MINHGITVLIASTMSQCFVEMLIMVKDYYTVGKRPYLSPSFVAVLKRDWLKLYHCGLWSYGPAQAQTKMYLHT